MRLLLLLILGILISCTTEKSSDETAKDKQSITLYTHRHYDTDKAIIKKFEDKTGITVNVVKASADELMQKLESEGDQSPADLLMTVDAGRLVRAKEMGLLQSVESDFLTTTIPEQFRDSDNNWFSLTKRARVIVYDKNRVNVDELSTYEALTEAKWNNKILIRSSGNIYNQSLMASIIANKGKENAKIWAEGMVNNFARTPKGNDRDQVKAILAGEGDLAIVNTYYIGNMINSEDPNEVEAGNAISIFFPNQAGEGTHINVSGIGITKYAPNKKAAIEFVEFLASKEIQELFAEANYEYPVNPNAESSELLKSWGSFKEDSLALAKLGELNKEAVITFDEVGWK